MKNKLLLILLGLTLFSCNAKREKNTELKYVGTLNNVENVLLTTDGERTYLLTKDTTIITSLTNNEFTSLTQYTNSVVMSKTTYSVKLFLAIGISIMIIGGIVTISSKDSKK